ncbi:MAG: radical SAM protein [Candidatus Bathyarchaeota archaeon]|uniref:radical SAM/SPASM domain-containing protein n=1 Tax=Candidatus Bathycorpusculum sp. TaxID=2994959 RepID=UPI002839A02F|nr:radical SAM protein [Candidatus Termiticorpusculum sp.]MCL2256608.1 radical SAM protein [Candidatus Termiticorpusculum sp.]MCL2293230.1 radical SAM protein [Candidatus Termiticorpusculum sp.]
MSILSYDTFWNAIVSMPMTKKMLRLSLRKCNKCGRSVLEAALDDYGKKTRSQCEACSSIYNKVIAFWIEFLRKALGFKRVKVEQLLTDKYARNAVLNLVESFEHFGIKKPMALCAPFLVVWDFTHKCNLRCKHCYSNSGEVEEEELTTQQALAVVDQLADAHVTALAFSGGEPLTRKDFFQIARYAADRGLYVSLASNGTLLTKENVQKLKEAKVNYVDISIDGATAKTHDDFRGINGAFEKTLVGLKNCVEADICTCIATTVGKNNLTELPGIIDLAEQLEVERFTYFNFIPAGRGKNHVDQDLSPQEREEVMRYLLNRMSSGCKTTILATAPQLARVAAQCQGVSGTGEVTMALAHMQTVKVTKKAVPLGEFIGGCGAGRLYCSISPQGDIRPCVFLPTNVGNLKTRAFKDIWLNAPLFNAFRNRSNLKGSCSKCTYKYICGGCRARSAAYNNGDTLNGDPGCIMGEKNK